MQTHIIKSGVVVNTIVATVLEAKAAFPDAICIDGSVGGIGWTWDGNTLSAPAPDIAALKVAKNAQINQWRATANQTTFPHGGKQIACDQLSRSDIDAVANSIALTGAFPAGFPGAWRAVDNTYIMLPDVAAFKAMHASMTAQGTINFGHSQELKAALAAATIVAEIDAIVW